MGMYTFLKAIQRNWWMIALATLLTTGTTALVVARQAPVYRAATAVELKPSPVLTDPRTVLNAVEAINNPTMVNTMARKASGSAVESQVAQRLGIPLPAVQDSGLTAIVLPETNLIEIRAQSTNPELAANIANTAADVVIEQTLGTVLQMDVIDRATPPVDPIGPGPKRFIALAVVFGLALGLLFALLDQALRMGRMSGLALGAAAGGAIFARRPAEPVEVAEHSARAGAAQVAAPDQPATAPTLAIDPAVAPGEAAGPVAVIDAPEEALPDRPDEGDSALVGAPYAGDADIGESAELRAEPPEQERHNGLARSRRTRNR